MEDRIDECRKVISIDVGAIGSPEPRCWPISIGYGKRCTPEQQFTGLVWGVSAFLETFFTMANASDPSISKKDVLERFLRDLGEHFI